MTHGEAVPSARIGVVLVDWNSADLTRACLASLRAGTVRPWRVVVVDNGSAPPFPASDRNEVQVLRNDANRGFCTANNQGLRALLAAGATAVWVLNNDTEVAPDCLAALAARLDAPDAPAVVVPKIVYAAQPDRIWYAGGAAAARSGEGTHAGLGQPDGPAFDRGRDVTFATGCAMLARREAWETIGMLRDAYFAYYEDVEWSLRAQAAGQRMAYVPAARVAHKVHAVLRRNLAGGPGYPPRFHYLTARNRLFTIRLHARGPDRALGLAVAVGRNLALLAGLALCGRGAKCAARGRGFWEGLTAPLPPLAPPSGVASHG